MRRKTTLAFVLISLSLMASGLVADNQPEKKVMNFVAVMDLKCGEGIKADVCKSLTDIVISELVKIGKYTVIDRANRDKILSEQGFQQTGCVDESCTVDAGRLLGVGKIVTGSITMIGDTYLVNLQLINVQTAAVENVSDEKCKCELSGLIDTVRSAATKLMSHEVPPPAVTPIQPLGPIPPATSPQGVGTLVITTNPTGADVFLDAQSIGKTPLTIPKVAEGLHQLTITLKGYVTLSKNIEVRVSQTATVKEILSQQTGAIDLQSTPAGADCWVDGKYIGKTPRKIQVVVVGKHSVKMTLPNYSDYTGETNVEANETAVVNAPLAGLPGRILVTSAPDGAEVYIDGKKAGVTPYSGQIASGSHQVRASMNGYQSGEEAVVIEPNKPKTLNLILKKGPDVRGDMVIVPAGEFTMGSTPEQAEVAFQACKKYFSGCQKKWFDIEQPVHKVYLDAFQIDKYEVTNKQYSACVQTGKCSKNQKYYGFTDPKQPVVVNWNQAKRFCEWAGKRLPTEAEWEKAARGTDGRTYPWGEGIDCGKANYSDCENAKTKPVGSYPSSASPYGAMDMAGNVWEWVADWYGENYYQSSPSRNPTGPSSGKDHVVRGGSLDSFPFALRSSFRYRPFPYDWLDYNYGVRCARTPYGVQSNTTDQAPISFPSTQPSVSSNNVGDMVMVPAGEFTMGSDIGGYDERPVHKVYLDAFQIDKYEVTNEQYSACVKNSKCSENHKYGGFTDPKQPVVGVDWNQASTFCSWEGKRFPTEAEWEKAARGTDGRTYPWGNQEPTCDLAVFNFAGGGQGCGRISTWPVGSKPSGASPYGAMDMAGNVWEWVADRYDKNYYQSSPYRNPKGPESGTSRVLRGGSWPGYPNNLRSSYRLDSWPGVWNEIIGFRCAR